MRWLNWTIFTVYTVTVVKLLQYILGNETPGEAGYYKRVVNNCVQCIQ